MEQVFKIIAGTGNAEFIDFIRRGQIEHQQHQINRLGVAALCLFILALVFSIMLVISLRRTAAKHKTSSK